MRSSVFFLAALALACMSLAPGAGASPIPSHVCEPGGQALFAGDGAPYFGGDAIYYGPRKADDGAPRIAFAGYPDDGDWIARDSSAAGWRYANDEMAVELTPQDGRIELGDGTVIPCRKYIASAYADESATDGLALGSVLRAGPGTSHAKLGSLPMGADVAIYEVTDVMFDGYAWLKVAYGKAADGGLRQAYVWGGTVCTPNGKVDGVLFPCPPEALAGK